MGDLRKYSLNSSNKAVYGDSSVLEQHSLNKPYTVAFCTIINNNGNNALRLFKLEH